MATGDELVALAEDQRMRDAYVALRGTRPADRDFGPLAELEGVEPSRVRAAFDDVYPNCYEANRRIEVLRRQTFRCPDGDILVRSCERDWMLLIYTEPTEDSYSPPGDVGIVGSTVRRFRCGADGTWRHVQTRGEALVPECRDIERICDGYRTDWSRSGHT